MTGTASKRRKPSLYEKSRGLIQSVRAFRPTAIPTPCQEGATPMNSDNARFTASIIVALPAGLYVASVYATFQHGFSGL